MHFTGLKIVGFKSFADPVDFTVYEGLTGIVGPNGCGKSNILEALRWVMGATSARAMRGGEMDDLIFSGSSNRPSRELADVALILDNSARRAPSEFNDSDEIEVRRRLRRGAGSTYKINGKIVRAKDVQLLFADASTGANSPALVRQGQISELIASKPQNRRRILEEAAGISGLNQRRHEAELKLKGAADGLSRLDEIIGEVDKQLNSLKRQASRAKKYKLLQEQIDAIEIQISFFKWKAAREELELAISHVSQTSLLVEETAAQEANSLTSELALREQIPTLRENETKAAAHLGLLKLESARLDGERKAASDAIIRLEQDLKRVVEDQSREHALREEALDAANRAKANIDSLPQDDESLAQKKRAILQTNLDDARQNVLATEAKFDEMSHKLANIQAEGKSAQALLTRTQINIENLNAEKKRVENGLLELGHLTSLEENKKAVLIARTQAQKALTKGTELVEITQLEIQKARDAETKTTHPLFESEKEIRIIEAEIAGLKRLIGKEQPNHFQSILDNTHPNLGWERALAAALGDDLNASINNEDSQYWSERHGTSDTALPEGSIPLSDLVDAPSRLLARLSQCGVVEKTAGDKLQSSLSQGQRLVSKEGDLWRWDGFVRTAKAPSSASEKLEQRAQITNLEKRLITSYEKTSKLRKIHEEAASTLHVAQKAACDAQIAIPILSQKLSRCNEDVMQNEQAIERITLRKAAFEDNIARIKDALLTAQADIDIANAALNALNDQETGSNVEALKIEIRELREIERTAQNKLSEFESEKSRNISKRFALAREFEDWSRRADAADNRVNALHSQRTGIRMQLENAKSQPSGLDEKLNALSIQLEEAHITRQQAADALSVLEASHRESELKSRQTRDANTKAREELIRAETRIEAAQRREIEIGDTIRGRFSLEYDALEDLSNFPDVQIQQNNSENGPLPDSSHDSVVSSFCVTTAEKELALLLRERDALGGVNMEADLQVEETAERLETQLREREDLDKALVKLHEGLNALNAQGRLLLLEAFDKVAEHFRVLFEALFEGGEAQLKLTESDDPLDAGLEIFACPPGKRLSALSLMSGGEQALTAAALIFAVFLSQPSPLCVLDEVDAPLDDANVDRFCRMLDTMRSRTDTRFVVITHNPVTMSRMDRLYGVTMQERGVSRLVSVDLQSAEQLVAAQ